MVEPLTRAHAQEWLDLRQQLWPDCSDAEHLQEMEAFLCAPDRYAQFISYSPGQQPAGFVEASVRHDYVNGVRTSPVAFLEGIFVAPTARRRGIARELVEAVSTWARSQGINELASDADLGNTASQSVHLALGFEETERVVFFRMSLKERQ